MILSLTLAGEVKALTGGVEALAGDGSFGANPHRLKPLLQFTHPTPGFRFLEPKELVAVA